jgi:hypothetical protein
VKLYAKSLDVIGNVHNPNAQNLNASLSLKIQIVNLKLLVAVATELLWDKLQYFSLKKLKRIQLAAHVIIENYNSNKNHF